MAVYTEVPDDELARLPRGNTTSASVDVFKGIAEGVENSNYLSAHRRSGALHPDALREARERERPAVLPRPDGASRAQRASTARRRSTRSDGSALRELCGRPAAIVTLPRRRVAAPRRPREHCARSARRWPSCMRPARDFALQRAERARRSPAGARWREDCARRADAVEPGWPTLIARRARRICEAHWPRGLPRRRDPRRPLPRQCVLRSATSCRGMIDFYFACTDLLAYDLAVCLNAWCFETDGSFNADQGAGAGRAAISRSRALSSRRRSRRCRCWRAAAALRFLLTRLYDWLQPRRRAPGAAARTRCEYRAQAALPPARASAAAAYGI